MSTNQSAETRSRAGTALRRGRSHPDTEEFGPQPVGRRQRPDASEAGPSRAIPGDHLRLGAGESRHVRLRRNQANRGGTGRDGMRHHHGRRTGPDAGRQRRSRERSERAESIGIRVDLPFEQDVNAFVTQAFEHRTFFTRLHQFVLASDAFVVAPGGIGTVLETMMIWQLLQVGHLQDTPLILVGQMWPGLIEWARDSMLSIDPPLASAGDIAIPHCVANAEEAIETPARQPGHVAQPECTAIAEIIPRPVSGASSRSIPSICRLRRSNTSGCAARRSFFSPGSRPTSNRCSLPDSCRYFHDPDTCRVAADRPPEQRTVVGRSRARADRHQILAVERIRGSAVAPAGGEQRRRPVHRDRRLIGDSARPDHARPAHDRRNAQAAFPEVPLLERERPVERIPLAAVVAGEDDQRVAIEPRAATARGGRGRCPRPCFSSSRHRSSVTRRSVIGPSP